MGVISRLYNFASGGTIRSSEVNAEFNQILNTVNGNIDQNNLKDDAVTTPKIVDGAVTEAKLAAGAVTNAKYGTNSIDASKLGSNSVTTDKLVSNSVTNAKLAAGAVTNGKYAADSIDASKLGVDSVTTAKIVNGAVTDVKLGTNRKAVDSSLTADNIVHASTMRRFAYGVAHVIPDAVNPVAVKVLGIGVYPNSNDGLEDNGGIGLSLPDGSTISKMTIKGYTAVSDGVIYAYLYKFTDSGSGTLIGSVTLASGNTTVSTAVLTEVVDNNLYSYLILLSQKATTSVLNSKFTRTILEIKSTNLKQV